MSEKPATREGGNSRFALSSWPLRRKVALALAVPLVLAATLGGLRVAGDLNEAASSSAGARQVTVLRPAVDYLTAGSRAMVAAQSDTPAAETELAEAIGDLEAAAGQMARTRTSADLTEAQGRQVDVILDLSRALREETETLSPGTWVAQLRQLQTGVAGLIASIDEAQLEPEPRLQQLSQALAARFSLAMQQALVATERSGDTGSLELFAELGAEGAAIDRLAGDLGEAEPTVLKLLIDNAVRTRTVRTGGTDLGGENAYLPYDRLVGSLMDGIDQELASSADAARSRALMDATVTLAALVAAIAIALLVSMLLLRPIRRVREGALTVAHVSLPDAVARIRAGDDPGAITPIDVTTEEEIGQLARAVDDLHQQAVVLAAGEADLRAQISEMFVTLSRRNTALVNQQLGLIESLEKDEEDPSRLESLFRLDHLASRMRRTADSLLVLADAPSKAAQEGLTVGEAMQAATAGVQDYRRVQTGIDVPVRISPEAAADVVHLLTELVDNALAYSPPSTTVLMGSTVGRGGVVVDVADSGLGIPDDELEAINQRLRSGDEVTADTARRMGLFVVSRLARRHGITVSLQRNERGGTTATVLLPVDILPELLRSRLQPPAPEPVQDGGSPVKPDPLRPKVAAKEAEKPLRAVAPVPEREPVRRPEPPPSAQRDEAPANAPVASLINAVLGLPNRAPGATGLATAPAPSDLPARVPGASLPTLTEPEPVRDVPEPAVDTNAADADEVEVVEAAEVEAALEDGHVDEESPAEAHVETPDETGGETDEAVPAAGTQDQAALVAVAAPTSTPAEAATSKPEPTPALDPLGGPLRLVPGADLDDDDDTPIFREMRSAWLSSGGAAQPWTTSEVERGWEVADRVTAAPPAEPEVTQSGLPVRRRGASLVPGGVTKPTASVERDPEAIRKRLAAHAAGVSRGRNAVPRPDRPHPEAERR